MWGNRTQEALVPIGEGSTPSKRWNSTLAAYFKFNNYVDGVTVPDASGRRGFFGTISGMASLLWTTVPYLKPSFNRKRPRVGPPAAVQAPGPNGLMWENYTVPRKFQDFYDYVDPTLIQAEGTQWVRMLGFGFANSRWLTCEIDGVAVPTKFVGIDEVHCDINNGTAFGVMNLYPSGYANRSWFADDQATCAARVSRDGRDAHPLSAYYPHASAGQTLPSPPLPPTVEAGVTGPFADVRSLLSDGL
eukprot:6952457-Pyramimonas_sp.AAC.1